MPEKSSPPAVGDIVISKLDQSKHILFLYTSNEMSIDVFIPFLQTGLDDGGSSIYLSTGFTNSGIEEKFNVIQPRSRCNLNLTVDYSIA